MCFIKFIDSEGFLIALSSLDGDIKYITQAGKDAFQYLNPSDIVGKNMSLVLKDSEKLKLFGSNYTCASFPLPCDQIIEVETIHDDFVTALFSPNTTASEPASSAGAREASSPDKLASQPISPTNTNTPSSLAQAIRFQNALFHVINKDTFSEDEEELSFDDCFDDAAVECR